MVDISRLLCCSWSLIFLPEHAFNIMFCRMTKKLWFHFEENVFWMTICHNYITEGTYQAKQCRLVKSCVTTFPPSRREERVSTDTFMSSLNRTNALTSRRTSDHHHGEQTCRQEADALKGVITWFVCFFSMYAVYLVEFMWEFNWSGLN